ncbi:MAG: hypothetical protein N3D11_10475 [Candidatus Sumerlaeia bacterium]|nr:hypothetical protein [Candidatus Sumerlaeia bacterium]
MKRRQQARFLSSLWALALFCPTAPVLSGAASPQSPIQPPPTVTVLRATTAPVSRVVDAPPPGPKAGGALPQRPMMGGAPPAIQSPVSPATVERTPTPPAKSIRDLPAPTLSPIPTPAPPPAATPTATPIPQQPFRFVYTPPLSVEEAAALIRAALDILSMKDPATLIARCQKACEIMDAVSAYLNVLDRRHSSLASYQWHLVDSEKVDGPGVDRDIFLARPVIHNVSAISFAASFGDVLIHSVEVQDASGQTTTFTLKRLVEEKYPHEQICYLFFPTAVRSVAIQYEAKTQTTRTPRLAVFAGIALEEEYLKQALWYLRYARREASQAARLTPNTDAHLQAACQNLRLAAQRLIRFRIQSR